ncbi:hypothetical protein [Streptomyces rishiriensis]|uniref:Uncharacterized protein n=1 Tax=Streptomyces rishiriensis TaxID=68264 RepID=A0ABU0P111_STRRH|nr:hypothetical protein [Streptomyces rishiriensis]MDQ0585060.1 hypothetical protein [Streptomyces rishiriensis]
MERWPDDAQPEGPDDPSGAHDTVFAGRRTGIRTRAVRAGSFWEAAKEPGSARTEATAPLPVGAAVHPAFTAEPLHDADELTVQLAGVDPASTAAPTGRRLESQDGAGTPVFVDESGRRSRRLRRLGVAVGIACSVYALVIVATLVSGNSSAPWLPLPGQGDDTPAGKVETSPVPAVSQSPSGSGSAAPGAGSAGSAPTASSMGGAGDVPGATVSPGGSQASALPEASTGTTTANPTVTATASGPAVSDSAAASPEASQSDSAGTDPSPSAVDDTGGTGEILGEANSVSSGG